MQSSIIDYLTNGEDIMADPIASNEYFVLIEANSENPYKWLDATRNCEASLTALATIDSPELQAEAQALIVHCKSSEVLIGAVVMNGYWNWLVFFFVIQRKLRIKLCVDMHIHFLIQLNV